MSCHIMNVFLCAGTAFTSVESHAPREAKAPQVRSCGRAKPVSRLPRQLLGLAGLLAALAVGLRVSKSDAGARRSCKSKTMT